MTRGAGVVRSAESLAGARAVVDEMRPPRSGTAPASVAAGELANLLRLADALLASALRPDREPGRPRAARVPRDRPVVAPPPRPRARRRPEVGQRRERGPGRAARRAERVRPGGRARPSSRALAEDLGPEGDLTAALVPEDGTAHFALRARQPGVLAGRDCATETFRRVEPRRSSSCWHAADGDELAAGRHGAGGDRAAAADPDRRADGVELPGPSVGRRHPDGAASSPPHTRATRRSQVLDTRKTTPGLRVLEKAAVRAGGGTSHRSGLSDAVLVKDNHLAGTSITDGGAPGPGAVAGAHGRDRVRRPRPGGRGGPGGRRRRAARQHGPGHGGGGHRAWPTWTRRARS